MALNELDGQTTLSDSTTTNYHELVFPEELRGITVSGCLGLLGASVARSHGAECQWLRRAADGGACILLRPFWRARLCERRRDEASAGGSQVTGDCEARRRWAMQGVEWLIAVAARQTGGGRGGGLGRGEGVGRVVVDAGVVGGGWWVYRVGVDGGVCESGRV
jgi:hypothetical protein